MLIHSHKFIFNAIAPLKATPFVTFQLPGKQGRLAVKQWLYQEEGHTLPP
jgi:hypothetical protein